MKLTHALGREVTLFGPGDRSVFSYVYGQELAPKPFLDPICIPDGAPLGAFRPTDHMWHRGLWFTWKFVNDANYWEEGQGVQGHQHTVGVPQVHVEGIGQSITLRTDLEWRDRDRTSIHEVRQLTVRPGPEFHVIDWQTEQIAERDLKLDRTPYTTWGGYGGLVIRMVQSMRGGRLTFPDGSNSDYVAGVPNRWADLSGQLDGSQDRFGGVTFMDHPSNPRHPSPTYARTRPLDNFMNMAILFHEPMELHEGDRLALNYRVVLHNGLCNPERTAAMWNEFAESKFQSLT